MVFSVDRQVAMLVLSLYHKGFDVDTIARGTHFSKKRINSIIKWYAVKSMFKRNLGGRFETTTRGGT